jgi:hypothetical protein
MPAAPAAQARRAAAPRSCGQPSRANAPVLDTAPEGVASSAPATANQ